MKDLSVILLAGGKGTRMNSEIPKQFLHLGSQPIIHYSFSFFTKIKRVKEIVVVCEEEYQHFFQKETSLDIRFARPGVTREFSVYNGLQQVSHDVKWVCTHDGARPFLDEALFHELINEVVIAEAVSFAVPLKFTVKEKDETNFVKKTLDRSSLVEIQTPQIIEIGRASCRERVFTSWCRSRWSPYHSSRRRHTRSARK